MNEIQDILQLFVKQVRQILGKSLKQIIVYGSYARGDYKENSDIDIMILTELPEERIRDIEEGIYDLVFDIQMEYLVDISVIVKNIDQFEYWLGALPFYDNVRREGIVIDG